MTDKNIIKKLAIERCRLHISHLCALEHLLKERDKSEACSFDYMHGLFENLNRDLALIESLTVE